MKVSKYALFVVPGEALVGESMYDTFLYGLLSKDPFG